MEETKPLFGCMLRDAGFISQGMLEFGLKVQISESKKKIGQVLKSLGFVTDAELAKGLSKQSGLKYFAMEKFKPEVQLIEKIPYQYAEKHKIFPVAFINGTTFVAIADPYSEAALNCIRQFIPDPITFMVSPFNVLLRAIEHRYYLASHPVQRGIDQIQAEISRNETLRTADLICHLNYTAIELNASDMHISTTESICFISYRIDGVLQLRYTFPAAIHARIVSAYKLACNMDITETQRVLDGHGKCDFQGEAYDLRVSTMPTVHGENLVVRYLTTTQECKSVEELGFSAAQLKILQKYLDSPSGVILCTGPTGSGKTTTLYGIIRRTNYLKRNVLTVEDPVEFKIPLVKQVSVNEKAGITFASAIRGFLRQDPDVILIGEIRDEETALLAIRAAQTGHLMLSTLHTNDAIGSIARLRDLGVANYLLASTLSCVIAQRLVRKLCSACKTKITLSPEKQKNLGVKSEVVYQNKGCDQCFDSGYLGRIAVAEILELSPEMRDLIERGESSAVLKKQMLKDGVITLRESVLALIQSGITDEDEYFRVLNDEL